MSLYVRLKTLFDDSPSNVDTGKRFFAYLIDWFLGALFMMFPICLLWLFQTHDMEGMSRVSLWLIQDRLSTSQAYLAGCIGILFSLFYYVVIPWKIFPGQTLGKRAVGIKIVSLDEKDVSLKTLLVRQVIGIMILEGVFYNVSDIWHTLVSMMSGLNFTGILMYQGLIVGIFSAALAMVYKSHRLLHDYLAKTKVVLWQEPVKK
ncbi:MULTISPECIES: RDD family protein [Faecalicoccus]|uniref:RDD family protein n=1 Tax=Faecalicoccus TaxID=1573536 RepID=UPI002433229B|nr:RDD family protein [Faecalicoccus pleomorphus]MDM8293069.1 RDD family protein [Faecalicoccus pleomorphus]